MDKVILTENIYEHETFLLTDCKIDGKHKVRLFNKMEKDLGRETTESIFSNAYKLLNYLSSPYAEEKSLSKVLCLGKVQSGKTAFFIASTALAFDNNYQLVYLIGGTKTTLKDQNLERAIEEFVDDEDIVLYDFKKTNISSVETDLKNGKKVILVVLKNPSEKTNLGKMKEFTDYFTNVPSLIIDDEGDEHTPGAPKRRTKVGHGGRVHDRFESILNSLHTCTYLSVTATPQANLLLSTIDSMSPDFCVLVNPGKGYTGGNAFHDVINNPHTIEIRDADDFVDSIPDTFKNALFFYIVGCCIKRCINDDKYYSMLVHPSSLTAIQTEIKWKIDNYIERIISNLSDTVNVSYQATLEELYDQYNEYNIINPDFNLSFEDITKELPNVLNKIKIYEFNYNYGKEDIKASASEKEYYKIYVGGNMLSRGLTIDNLTVSYIFRDSKITAIDSLYQRARWFGYKKNYFDICRVYMTRELKQKFIATVESENDMWNTINSFLLTNTSIRLFPRVFTLNNDSLTLTRPSVSKTIVIKRINPGYTYDKTVFFDDPVTERKYDREVFEAFMKKWDHLFNDVKYGTPDSKQIHKIASMKYSDFLNDFIRPFHFQINSRYGQGVFESINEKIEDGTMDDNITVVVMRYKQREKRSLDASGMSILELPQGRNDGTEYEGDAYLTDLQDKFYVQIHLVYHEDNSYDDYLPMIAMNNPITSMDIRYVTGDNEYA